MCLYRNGVPDYSDGLSEGLPLTDAAAFKADYYSVPAPLQPYIAAFYQFRCDETQIRDMHPSNVSHLVMFLRGQGSVHFRTGVKDALPRIGLFTPCACAASYYVNGPLVAVGAVLTPLGWAALARLDAGEHGNRLYDASGHFGPEAAILAGDCHQGYLAGELRTEEIVRKLGLFIEANLQAVNPRHARLIALVMDWLSEKSDGKLVTLHAAIGYSHRQVQRLTQRFFGLPPKALLRKSRALRAAAIFSNPRATADQLACVSDHFYDQSHMIREIRLFVGRTPGRLRNLQSLELSTRLRLTEAGRG